MPLFSVSDSATLFNAVTSIALFIGIVFGLIQLRQAVRGRRNHAAVDIVRTVQTQEVRRAVRLIFSLPTDADPETIRNDPALLDAALAVDSACEMWGCMVFEGVVGHRMLDRMVGGWVRGTWTRLHRWVQDERDIAGNPNIGEWWEWLYEVLAADPDPGKTQGAHVYYRKRKK